MLRNEPDHLPDADSAVQSSADDKRRMARRRFLARSATAGSGFFVVTLYHKRAFGTYGGKTMLVSSPEVCQSLGGQTGTNSKINIDASIGIGNKVTSTTAYACDVPYQK
jgi:hypothetical protein